MISPTILRTLVHAAPAVLVAVLVVALGSAISYRAGDQLAGTILWIVAAVLIVLLATNLLLLLLAVAIRQLHDLETASTDDSPSRL